MKRIKSLILAVLALIFIYTVAGFVILPAVLHSLLPGKLAEVLHRSVNIDKIKFNPYTLVFEIQGMSVKDNKGPGAFVSLRSFMVDMEWASLFKVAPVIREVKLANPSVRIIRLEDGTYNFSDLMKGGGHEGNKGKPLAFSISNIQVKDGMVVMDDRPVHKVHTARGINIAVPFVSNMPYYADVFVEPLFQANINGTPFRIQGRTKPFSESLETTLALNLKDISIPYYLAYVPMKRGFDLDSGVLNVDALFSFRQYKNHRKPKLDISAELTLKDLDVKDQEGNPLLNIAKAYTRLAPSNILGRKVHIALIAVSSPEIDLSRDKKGMLNLMRVVKKTRPTEAKPAKKQDAAPVSVNVDEIALSGGKISYIDHSGSSPVKLSAEDLTVTARNITTDSPGGGKADLTCTLNQTGHLSLETSFVLTPLSADATLSLDGFKPSWVQPYLIDRVPILIRRGTISTRGQAKLAFAPKRPPKIKYKGDMQFADFASVDRAHAKDLVSWRDLRLTGLDFSMNPDHVVIREIRISSPASSFVITEGGGNNFAEVFGQDKSRTAHRPAPQSKKKKPKEKIVIGRIVLKNGRFTFSDRSIAPHYSASLTGISGSVTGLSTDEFKKAAVALTARLDNQSPLSITGSVNPLKRDPFVDLAVMFTNIELSPATPYSGKYLGYAIDKGKLSLRLKYLIDRKVLQAENDVLIDQLTFGEAVDSKDATRLPVRLAVVLLRDNSGRIDLHLPVTGRTDDPDFHVGKIVIHTLVNILKKAATSPFALLEAIYPGSTDLGFITFEPGRSSLTEENRKKIDTLARILNDKASLNLELTGYADAANDKSGLAEYLFECRLKEQKLKDLLRQGKQASPLEDITMDQKEYSACLQKAYRAFDFPGKPRNALGLLKSLSDDEMKNLMLKHLTVTDDDLRALADARSKSVRDYLVETGNIDPARIFIKAGSLTPEKIDKVADSRVSLSIR